VHDHDLLIALHHPAHAASQGKPGFSGYIGSRELRRVGQVINVAHRTCFANPKIHDRQSVDRKRIIFSFEAKFAIAPSNADASSDRPALDRYPARGLAAFCPKSSYVNATTKKNKAKLVTFAVFDTD
jgi:hypothetical protein